MPRTWAEESVHHATDIAVVIVHYANDTANNQLSDYRQKTKQLIGNHSKFCPKSAVVQINYYF